MVQMSRPVVGLNADFIPAGKATKPHLRLNQGYAEAVLTTGGLPVLMPLLDKDAEIKTFLDRVDGFILTIRLSKKSGPQAVRAREILATLGVKGIGVVVNGVRVHRQGYEGYGYESYAYSKHDYSYHGHRKGSSDSYYEEDTKEASAR